MHDKSVETKEISLTFEDRKELKSQNFLFIGGIFLLFIVGLMFYFLVFHTWPWRLGIFLFFSAFITLLASSMYSNVKDLSYGKKIITTGRIWDVYEKFETQLKKRPSDFIGKRSFYYKVGDREQRYYLQTFDPTNSSEHEAKDEDIDKLKAGQLIEMHNTQSGYLLREKILDANTPKLNYSQAAQFVNYKVKSKRKITQYFPREWRETEKGNYFYLVSNGLLFAVSESNFNRIPIGTPVKVNKEDTNSEFMCLAVMLEPGVWQDI